MNAGPTGCPANHPHATIFDVARQNRSVFVHEKGSRVSWEMADFGSRSGWLSNHRTCLQRSRDGAYHSLRQAANRYDMSISMRRASATRKCMKNDRHPERRCGSSKRAGHSILPALLQIRRRLAAGFSATRARQGSPARARA